MRARDINNELNVEILGQVFTQESTVQTMLSMMKNTGAILEPSSGDGAFAHQLPLERLTAIEFDVRFAEKYQFLQMDFFALPLNKKFSTIIGNPPYVRYQDIHTDTKQKLEDYAELFDRRSNLYLFFIYKCILHLEEGGELIFITPRDFIKATSARKLNEYIYQHGTITEYIEMGDQRIFKEAVPNTAIWRFEKDCFSRKTNETSSFYCSGGQLLFTKNEYPISFADLAFVKVGAVSGADACFEHPDGLKFVCSKTRKTGETRQMIYYQEHEALLEYKDRLLGRRIKKFSEKNWWEWGRRYYVSEMARLYVNNKTRIQNPFFLSDVKAYDGSVLAIFPKFACTQEELKQFSEALNHVNWNELGFIIDGRYVFTQRSLEQIVLPKYFEKYLSKI
jgi:adenine-specific DNA-methyltransferase